MKGNDRMKNINVINTFINGGNKSKTANVHIEDDKLFNYGTCIAERFLRVGGQEYGFVINATKYSQTTTTIQNMLLNSIDEDQIVAVLTSIPMGETSLSVN